MTHITNIPSERILEEPTFTEWSKQPFTINDCMNRCPEVFAQGQEDCKRFILEGEPQDHKTNPEFCNPYPQSCTQFYCWNRGWNDEMARVINTTGYTQKLQKLFDSNSQRFKRHRPDGPSSRPPFKIEF